MSEVKRASVGSLLLGYTGNRGEVTDIWNCGDLFIKWEHIDRNLCYAPIEFYGMVRNGLIEIL